MKRNIIPIFLALAWTAGAGAQDPVAPAAPPPAPATFDSAAAEMQQRLETSLAELTSLRQRIADEKIPLSRKLSELEGELMDVRKALQDTTRMLDARTFSMATMSNEIKARREQNAYLSNLLADYIRNFESRLHIAELQRYRDTLASAKGALEASDISEGEVFERQIAVVDAALERMHDLLGGARFEGTAVVGTDRLVKQGTFLLVGPAALFVSGDGAAAGTVEQQIGSLEPSVVGFQQPADETAARRLVQGGGNLLPLDPTLGSAHAIETTKETWWEHVNKGGPVMVPIFALAGAAFLVALVKWLFMLFVRKPSRRRVDKVLEAVARGDKDGALKAVRYVRGPGGRMLKTGVEHVEEPRELIEEVMYEKVLATRLKLQRMLPFIAISAAAAPLLGLLGTVTGIINTFKLITVFGTGDVKMLSSGISEALITTEYGLIVAIPSLLIHALLSRKAKGIVDHMEKAAVALVNQVSKSPFARSAPSAAEPAAAVNIEQIRALLTEMLAARSRDAVEPKPMRSASQHREVVGASPSVTEV